MRLGDPFARDLAEQGLKIDERIAAYSTGGMDKVVALMSVRRSVDSGRRIFSMSANIVKVYPRRRPRGK